MKNKHLWIPAFVFIGACVVSLIYSIIDFKAINPDLAYSDATIQFNYNGASDGKDPNGNRFDPVGFLTDDVVESALEKSQLTYQVEKIRPYIALENIVPDNIVEEINSYEKVDDTDDTTRTISTSNYYPVRYRFVVYHDLDKKLSKNALNAFVNNIVDEYCEKFYQTYKKSFANEAYNELIDISDYDYIHQTQIYSSKFNILMDYAMSIYDDRDDLKPFKNLFLKAQQFVSSDVNRSKQLISFNALSNDVELVKSYYNYLKNSLINDKNKYEADQLAFTNQVTAYSVATPSTTVTTATGGMVVTIDSNTVETYNALVAKQVEAQNKVAAITKQIQECDDALTKLNSATGDEDIKTVVDELLVQIGKDYDEVEKEFLALVETYNEKYVEKDTIDANKSNYVSNSLFSGSFVKRAIKVSLPIMLTVVLGIVFYFLGREVKKEKNKAE